MHNIQFRKEKKVSQRGAEDKVSQRGAEEKVEKVQHISEPSQSN